jgi:hypothetical protein
MDRHALEEKPSPPHASSAVQRPDRPSLIGMAIVPQFEADLIWLGTRQE